jgi:hypothetical protein
MEAESRLDYTRSRQFTSFIDRSGSGTQNGRMRSRLLPLLGRLSAGALATLALSATALTGTYAAPPLYWCPERAADQQYGATRLPGCVPLVEKENPGKATEPRSSVKLENIQQEATSFLNEYRRYLQCCSTDPDSIGTLEILEDRAWTILKTAQDGLFSEQMKLRGFTLSEVIPPVARARDQLREIRRRLDAALAIQGKPQASSDDQAGHERPLLEAIETSVPRDLAVKPSTPSPKTGTAIGETPPSGPHIGKVPPTGSDFGAYGRTGSEVGYTPPTGKSIGQNAPTGFEIGKTGVAGPAIGDSDLDRRPSDVSSTLSGSSVGSNLSTPPPGSSLPSSRVGSDLGSRPIESNFGGPARP